MIVQLFENISLAISGLRANKMRALLTMLGIIIGIGSVIAIVTVGDAMTSSVTKVFNDMGANSIQLRIKDKPDESGLSNWTRQYTEEDYISDEMIETYISRFGEQIQNWSVTVSVGPGKVQNGRNSADIQVYGTNANGYIPMQNMDIVAGHDLRERDIASMKRVTIVSDKTAQKLFPGHSLQQTLGKTVKLKLPSGTYEFLIGGIYRYEVTGFAASMVGDTSTMMFVPHTLAKTLGPDISDGYYAIQIRAAPSVTDTQKFARQTESFFNRTLYRGNKYVHTSAESMDSMIGQMTGMMTSMQLAVSVIAGISLLVGGIGVMNIMLVSVTERTREVGTRKALGAKNSAIRVQFIVEAIIICMIGGILGVLVGTGLGYAGAMLLGGAAFPSLGIVVIAVGFSMVIGVFFGYYPANKAAKLDPIEALRYE